MNPASSGELDGVQNVVYLSWSQRHNGALFVGGTCGGFVGMRFKVKHCTPLGMLLRAASHFEVEDGAAAEAVGGTG
jgi:hypothetical protein